jgi:hypothetical protein
MGILDLSLITKSLINLLTHYFKYAPEKLVTDPAISSQRPDQLSGNAVGLYLYHICEDPHSKNQPAPEDSSAGIQFCAMRLHLYYQLVAQYLSDPTSSDTAIFEQNMMGIAIKALHDFAIIDEKTKLIHVKDDGTKEEFTIFNDSLKGTGTRLRIELLNIDQKDAMGYWGTSHAAPRLAAYYKVSVVILKPEVPPSRPGRVLSYGVSTFAGNGPRIEGCSNKLVFMVPGETAVNEIELRPAQSPPNGKIVFYGSGFSGGKVDLLLKNANWENPLKADNNWQLTITKDGITVVVQKITGTTPVNPGIYSACVQMTKQIRLPDDTLRDIIHLSNECPFVISPFIESVTKKAAGSYEISGYIFKDPGDGTELKIQLYIGNIKYKQGTGAGSFMVTAADKITFLLAADTGTGNIPVRLFVNGAESPPTWITII